VKGGEAHHRGGCGAGKRVSNALGVEVKIAAQAGLHLQLIKDREVAEELPVLIYDE